MRYVVIGLVAGLFSALFGVGGGIVVVPLLILVAHFSERPAMGTSLAAVGLIAFVGAVSYGVPRRAEARRRRGRRPARGASAPSSAPGCSSGSTARTLSLGFAALLAGIAIWLLV